MSTLFSPTITSGIYDAPQIADIDKLVSTLKGGGNKFRRNADVAEVTNCWTKSYMKAVPPWQPSTAYVQYRLVANGGHVFICAIAGTSAATGGPTTITDGTSHADGTAQWIWWGYNNVANDPSLGLVNWAASTAYTLGQQVINGTGVYAVVAAGTSAGSGGPTGTSNAITDNTVTWSYMGPNVANPYAADFPTVTVANATPANPYDNFYHPARATGLTAGMSAIIAFPVAVGSGYAVNDTITLSGGTSTTATVLKVTSVSSGGVTGVSIQTAGNYQALNNGATWSQASTSGAGTGATFSVGYTTPSWYKLRGCYLSGVHNNSYGAYSFTYQAAQNAQANAQHFAMEFYTDSEKVGIALSEHIWGTNIIIDGVRYALDPKASLSAALTGVYKFDFTATGGRKKRSWRIEITRNIQFPGVYVSRGSTVWSPDDNDLVTAVCISDSILAGSTYGPYVGGNTISLRLGAELGWANVWNLAQGGTGYSNRGGGAGVSTDKYGYRIAQALLINPDVWVFMGSTNDNAVATATITAEALACYQAIRAGGSTAPIIVFGVWPLNNANVGQNEDAVKAAVTAFADPLGKTQFIPLYRDPYLPLITGSYNNNPAPSGVINTTALNSTLYIAGDSTHPPDMGTEYAARQLANAVRKYVLPNLI